jgi:hypothetical protein
LARESCSPGERATAEDRLVAHAILRYLLCHPDAGDTREGIASWWLRKQRIEEEVPRVIRALELLETCGFIVQRTGPDFLPHFRVNPGRAEEISRLLGRPVRQAEQCSG